VCGVREWECGKERGGGGRRKRERVGRTDLVDR